MAKEFFKAHFFPAEHTWRERFTNSLNYYLAAFFFNAFPLPQREAGARQTLQYIGELTGERLVDPDLSRGACGRRPGDIKPFRGGIGMIGSRLDVPVVPGADRRRRSAAADGRTFVDPGRCAWRSARRCGCAATTTPRSPRRWSGQFARSESPSTARVLTRSSTSTAENT